MKSCNMNRNSAKTSRIGILSFVTMMGLHLAMGTTLYAADFKLWKLDEAKKAGEPVSLISLERTTEAKKLLEDGKFNDYAERFNSEPTHFLDGVRNAIVALKEDGEKQNALMQSAVAKFKEVGTKFFKSAAQKEAFLAALEKLSKMNLKDLAEMTSAEFMEEVLGDKKLLADLGLTDAKEVAKKDEEKDEDPTPLVGTGPAPEEFVAQQTQPATGEITDESLRKQAQVVCDKFAEVAKKGDEQFKTLQDSFRELLNRFKQVSEQPQQVAKNTTATEDVVGPLLKALGKQDQQAQVAQPSSPVIAPTPAAEENPERNNSVLDQPLPPAQQPQVAGPMPFFSAPQSSVQRPQIALDLPSNRGARDLRTASDAITASEEVLAKGLPSMTNEFGQQNNPLIVAGQLGAAKAEIDGALAAVNSAYKTTNNRISTLDGELEQLKEGGRAALPEWVKNEQKRLAQVAETAKRNFETQRQQLTQQAQASGDQNQMAQVSATLGGMAQDMNRAEQELNAFNAEVETKVETGNKAIAALKNQRQSLEDRLADLKTQKGKLEVQVKQVTDMRTTVGQMYAASQAQGQGSAGLNVNRITGAAPAAGRSRTGIGGALTSSSVPSSIRGALGGTNGSTTLR
jgi:hypothetical protein